MVHCSTDVFVARDDGSMSISDSVSLKVCDFGVAVVIDDDACHSLTQNLTVDNEIWQSPQVQRGDRYDARAADMYVSSVLSVVSLFSNTAHHAVNSTLH